ncbi:MAG: DUF4386 domain-containing protein [Chloroflexota bacterium]
MNNQKRLAHFAGLLYLLIAIVGGFSMGYVPQTLTVAGDAAATINNLLTSTPLFRMGLVGEMWVVVLEIILTAVMYILLRPVSATLSLVAALARLSMTIIQGVNVLIGFGVLTLLGSSAFTPKQFNDLVILFVNLREVGVFVWEITFALHLLVLGYLFAQSRYIPRVLGWGAIVAGFGYGLQGFGNMLAPQYADTYQLLVMILAILPELSLTFWLLIRGVNVGDQNTISAPSTVSPAY